MSIFSSIVRAVANPATIAQIAMGPAGWASLATRVVVSAVAQQAIQQLGQQLGLPQGVINMAQSAFAQAAGTQGLPNNIRDAVSQLAEQFDLSPSEQGQVQRSAENSLRSLIDGLLEADEFKEARRGGKSGESIFMRIATILGKMADKKLGQMASLAEQIGGTKDGTKQNKITELSGQMNARAQEFGLISQAMTTVIKTTGENMATIARK